MKKKIILSLLVIMSLLVITGCGEKKELQNNNQQQVEKNENVEQNNSNTNSYIDDEIIEFDDIENTPMEEKEIVVEKVINCDGCVFSYFSDEKSFGSVLSENEYTTDVNKLKTTGGKQRHNFFGFILSENKISRAYSCILKENKIYCLEGSVNGTYHNSNIAILNQIFTSNQCKTISDGNTYTCTDGYYNGDTKTSGYTSLHYETSCTIYGSNAKTGKLICH